MERDTMNENQTTKPPIGLRPRWIHDQDRSLEIIDAARRYAEARKPIPVEWIDEFRELMVAQPPQPAAATSTTIADEHRIGGIIADYTGAMSDKALPAARAIIEHLQATGKWRPAVVSATVEDIAKVLADARHPGALVCDMCRREAR